MRTLTTLIVVAVASFTACRKEHTPNSHFPQPSSRPCYAVVAGNYTNSYNDLHGNAKTTTTVVTAIGNKDSVTITGLPDEPGYGQATATVDCATGKLTLLRSPVSNGRYVEGNGTFTDSTITLQTVIREEDGRSVAGYLLHMKRN
jgi:hypothetical protein